MEVDATTAEALIVEEIIPNVCELLDATIKNDSSSETPSSVDIASEMAVHTTTSISQSETVLCNLSILSEPHGNLFSHPSTVFSDDHTLMEIVEPVLNEQLCVDEEQREDNVQLGVAATVPIEEPSAASYSINNDNNDDDDGDDDWDGFQGPVVENSVPEGVVEEPPPLNGDAVDDEDDWDDFEGPVQNSVASDLPVAVSLPIASTPVFVPAAVVVHVPVIERTAAAVEPVEFSKVKNRFSQRTIQRATEMRNGNESNIVTVLQRELGGYFADEVIPSIRRNFYDCILMILNLCV